MSWANPLTPVPRMVSIDEGVANSMTKKLEFGVATPGTMATTTSSSIDLSSPLGIFSAFAASSRALFDDVDADAYAHTDDVASTNSGKTSKSQKLLGISRPEYESDDEDDVSVNSDRIGIVRTNYELPEGDIPVLSPMNMLLKKNKNIKKAHDSDDDGEDLWQLKLEQNEGALPSSMMSADDGHALPKDGVDRFLHKQTSEGHYLMHSRPLDAPMNGMKYSLDEGKGGMQPLQRNASDSRLFRQKTRPNILRASSSPGLEGGAFKVFLLLIAPKAKIFEIVQIFYSPLVTTVGNLLEMIPNSATEPALGAQQYTGLCRPKDGGLEIDVLQMASASSGGGCARIIRGEMMVAIPKGYSGPQCAKLAEPLLSHARVTKLLHKSDPLAPSKKKKKKKRRSSTSQRYKSITVESERSTNPYESSIKDDRVEDKEKQLLRQARQRGETQAASCNSQPDFYDSSINNDDEPLHMPIDLWQTQMSFRSDSSSASSVGSIGDLADFASPRNAGRSRRSSNLGYDIPEEVDHAPTLVDENLTPSPKGSSNDLGALQATLQTKDVSGAIAAFGKLLSSMGTQDEEVMKQLFAAVQKETMERS